ncbi:MAG: hypothetical protein JKX98_06565, partial [Alcanivoracaceae bacterium]|nr:hypothetical protein [Alcanivoracaceae bacterium]
MNVIIFREWFANKLYPFLFSLCIIVSLGAYLTLDALQQSVNDYVNDNQKQIVGGDIVITDNQQLPENVIAKISQLQQEDVVYDYQFNAIAYTESDSLLVRIKAVSSSYPLYGDLILANNTVNWPQGSVLVEQQVLSSLNVAIGDNIKIGESQFKIHDEIITEPDRPLTAFGFGARVILHDTDLKETQLMGQKSRISYRIEIKLAEERKQNFLTDMNKLVKNTKISVKTAEQSNTSISNLSQNFLIFLKLLVIAVIILSGIGIMSIVKAFVSKQKNTNAIRTALGERSSSVIISYRILFSAMALFSVLIAWIVSLVVLHLGKDIFTAILPNNIDLAIGWLSVVKAILIAIVLTTLMTHFTLNSIHDIKPVAVLHKHPHKTSLSNRPWLWIIFAIAGTLTLLYSELTNISQSLQVFAALIAIWFSFALLTKVLMAAIKWLLNNNIIKQWKIVLALQNIFRKGNQSNLFITTLSMTTMVLGTITILDHSIQQQLISTYPDDAPNLFLLDVQTNQQQQLDDMFAGSLTYYPVIRARIDSVNGIKNDVLKDTLGNYDNISRMFNLSYTNELLPTEELYESSQNNQLFTDLVDNDAEPLSILNSFAEFLQIGLGDEVIFNVQGIKIKTKITSIRKRLKRGPSPFFYFILPPDVMKDAPQIRFATAKISDDKRI